jgi:hypothetical protein
MNKDSAEMTAEERLKRGLGNRVSNTLEKHGVSDALVKELNRMHGSSVPRDALIQHVSTHFPEKKSEDWHDIVIAAIAFHGKPIPEASDAETALKHQADFDKLKFHRAKDSFETQKELLHQHQEQEKHRVQAAAGDAHHHPVGDLHQRQDHVHAADL